MVERTYSPLLLEVLLPVLVIMETTKYFNDCIKK